MIGILQHKTLWINALHSSRIVTGISVTASGITISVTACVCALCVEYDDGTIIPVHLHSSRYYSVLLSHTWGRLGISLLVGTCRGVDREDGRG